MDFAPIALAVTTRLQYVESSKIFLYTAPRLSNYLVLSLGAEKPAYRREHGECYAQLCHPSLVIATIFPNAIVDWFKSYHFYIVSAVDRLSVC